MARPAFKAGEPRQPRGGKVRLLRRSVALRRVRLARAAKAKPSPLTVGTAGHIDHGKSALVRALTGRDTDRLPEEQARGISIDLGFAQLDVGGRLLSLVDVPGHERFVRTMVAGASGVDLFLLVVAADDGVMPQTLEHAAVLQALGVPAGVVAITKSDLADTARAREEARELVGSDVPIIDCSARTGAGVEQVRAALGHVARALPGTHPREGPAVLHVDRSFTVHGAGTVVTGTLWSGSVGAGDRVLLLPAGAVCACAACRCTTPPGSGRRRGSASRSTWRGCGSTRSAAVTWSWARTPTCGRRGSSTSRWTWAAPARRAARRSTTGRARPPRASSSGSRGAGSCGASGR